MMLDYVILTAVFICGGLLAVPRLAQARLWRATVTPLASIIGSGFLVLGPILDARFGGLAPLAMAGLIGVSALFGSAIRYNIWQIDAGSRPVLAERVEPLASLVLAFAYVISVAYYLNLFGAFGVSLTAFDSPYAAKLLTSAVFVAILAVGWSRGFRALEGMERVSVGLKLAIIGGLLVGLAVHFAKAAQNGALSVDPATIGGWPAVTLMFGLIVTVQGFETSRYLGATYSAAVRVRSMRLAQALSAAIYMIYIALLSYVFDTSALELSETTIIGMMQQVAPVLPVLLVAAALSAQFSAAVADTGGSGGLMAELSGGRVPVRRAYALLVSVGLLLTWTSDIFAIISYASRAFAAYYALQCAIAALTAARQRGSGKVALFGMLALLGLAIAVFGQSVE